jgi:hypothetical protein
VPTDDPSELTVTQVAQRLIQCARADTSLLRRSSANDDGLQLSVAGDIQGVLVDDMCSRIQTLPEQRTETPVSLPRMAAVGAASNRELEELVAAALASAQDAEDISRRANEAGRRARRGTSLAIGIAVLGIAIATAGTIGARLLVSSNDRQMADYARQVRALGESQRHIDDQLARLHAEAAVQQASAVPAEAVLPPVQHSHAVPAPLAPLKARFVRVLPEEPQSASYSADPPPAPTPRAMSYTPTDVYASDPPPPAAVYAADSGYAADGTTWPRRRAPVRHYRSQVVVPQPVAYFIVSVQRDVQALFR